MFETLKTLIEKLEEKDFTDYKDVKTNRKILQQVKVEAQNLRKAITNKFKNLPKVKKEKSIALTKEKQLGKKELKVPTIGVDED